MISVPTVVTWLFYCVGLGVLGYLCKCILPIEEFVFTNMFLIHFEIRSAWKMCESRARDPQAWLPRKIFFDLFRVYYSPVLYQLLFIQEPDLMSFVYFLPKFIILEFSIYAITDDTFDWAYKNNKITRTLYCLLFNYLMCLDYIEALENVNTLRIEVPVPKLDASPTEFIGQASTEVAKQIFPGVQFLRILFYADLSQASCISQINIIEDFILTKFAKIKDEVNFQGFLVDIIVFFYLNLTTVILIMIKISLKEVSVGEVHLGKDYQIYYDDHLPSNFNGYDLDFIAKAVYLTIFLLPVCDGIQRNHGEKGILFRFRSLFPNMTSFKSKIKVKED